MIFRSDLTNLGPLRALLANRQAVFERREVILGCSANDGSAPHATTWHVNAKEQTAGRVVSIPDGMTLADALHMCAQ